jgi:hypothetical protein
MQVELVRDLINLAINEPREETRIGAFACFSRAYDEYTPILKHIFSNEKIREIKSEEFEIKRMRDFFLIIDCYGGTDFFTKEELSLFIHLWESAQILHNETPLHSLE